MCMSAVLYVTTKICNSAMICTGIKYGVITKKEKDAQKSTPLMTKNKGGFYYVNLFEDWDYNRACMYGYIFRSRVITQNWDWKRNYKRIS